MISDDLPFDLARIGEVLEHHTVRYVVIGGMSGTFKDHLALPELRRLRGDRYPELATDEDPFGNFNIEDGVD